MKKPTLLLISVLLLASLVQVTYLVTESFPGFHSDADCSYCHNEPASAYNSSYANSEITLDGNATEEFWVADPWYREMRIPIGSYRGAEEIFVTVIFAQNSTHLFIYASWKDVLVQGNSMIRFGDSDGFAIMWNVNGDDLPENFFNGMKTEEPGQIVDNWVWKAGADAATDVAGLNTSNGEKALVDANVLDTAFDDSGWDDDLDTSQDVGAAATWGYQSSRSTTNYLMEMARPLVTDDPADVQFDKIGYYEFAIAVYNGTSAADHLISFEHSVFIYGVCETDCDIPVVVTEYYPDYTTIVQISNSTVTTTESSSAPIAILPILMGLFSVMVITTYTRRKK